MPQRRKNFLPPPKRRAPLKPSAVRQVKKIVHKVIETEDEKKYLDISNVNFICDSAGLGTNSPIALSNVTQGPGVNQRDGAKIKPMSLDVRYKFFADSLLSVPQDALYRVIIARWNTDSSIATVNWTQILNQFLILSFYSKETVGQFKVLYDKFHYMTCSKKLTSDNEHGTMTYKHAHFDLSKAHDLTFTGAGANITGTNHYFMWFLTDADVRTTANHVVYQSRFNYIDS